MSQFTRRRFLGSPAALPIGLGLAAGACGRNEAAAGHASMIVTGARVLTMNSDEPTAEAVAIHGDRILAVGSDDDIRRFADASTTRIDGRGITVTPGFIDSHSHPLLANEALGVNVNFRRIEDVKKALAGKAQTPPGHDDTKFDDERPLNRKDIDEVVKDHPVFVAHRGGHTAVVNSKAFELAGILIDSPYRPSLKPLGCRQNDPPVTGA